MTNRQIKFRAWDAIHERIVYNVGIFDSGQVMYPMDYVATISSKTVPKMLKSALGIKDDSCTDIIMQFTGLTDKNGKEIYEGDVVNYRVGWAAASTYIGVVEWFDYYWGVQKEFGFGLLQDVEIIGNIYENPELIK